MSDVWVVNASPLIFLANAGRLDLLRAVAPGRIVVPDTVYSEVVSAGHPDIAATVVAGTVWLERTSPVVIPTSVIEWDLGPGESAVIATALEYTAARAVMDDLSGRKCAHSLGVSVMGTLGVVVAAHRRGHVEDPRQVLSDLRAAGMWLSDAVIHRTLQLAGLEP